MPGAVERAPPEAEHRRCRLRLGEEQGRDGEGLDVPHHVAVVVVVVPPLGESEDARAGRAGAVDGRLQVEERGVSARLPVLVGAEQHQTSTPQVLPQCGVAPA